MDDFDVMATNGGPAAVPTDYVGFQRFESPMVAVPRDFMDDFLDNAAVEAHYSDRSGDSRT